MKRRLKELAEKVELAMSLAERHKTTAFELIQAATAIERIADEAASSLGFTEVQEQELKSLLWVIWNGDWKQKG